MIAKLGGRKFVLTILVLIAGVAIDLFTSRGISENLLYLLMAIPTGFGVVNVGAHAMFVKEKQATQKPQKAVVDTSKVEAIVAELPNKVEAIVKEAAATSTDQEVLTRLQALQNSTIVMTDALKQASQLQGQTYQLLASALQSAHQK